MFHLLVGENRVRWDRFPYCEIACRDFAVTASDDDVPSGQVASRDDVRRKIRTDLLPPGRGVDVEFLFLRVEVEPTYGQVGGWCARGDLCPDVDDLVSPEIEVDQHFLSCHFISSLIEISASVQSALEMYYHTVVAHVFDVRYDLFIVHVGHYGDARFLAEVMVYHPRVLALVVAIGE